MIIMEIASVMMKFAILLGFVPYFYLNMVQFEIDSMTWLKNGVEFGSDLTQPDPSYIHS